MRDVPIDVPPEPWQAGTPDHFCAALEQLGTFNVTFVSTNGTDGLEVLTGCRLVSCDRESLVIRASRRIVIIPRSRVRYIQAERTQQAGAARSA